jgi:hypothetical protein
MKVKIRPRTKNQEEEKVEIKPRKNGLKVKANGNGNGNKPAKKKAKKLTHKQKRFVLEYIIDFNATRAARAAGYSKRSAEMTVSRMIRNDKVKEAIDKLLNEQANKLQITREKVLADLEHVRKAAFASGQYAPSIKATELHGKHLNMFSDRLLHGLDPVTMELQDKMTQVDNQVVNILKGFAEQPEEVELTRTTERIQIKPRKKTLKRIEQNVEDNRQKVHDAIIDMVTKEPAKEEDPSEKGISIPTWEPL